MQPPSSPGARALVALALAVATVALATILAPGSTLTAGVETASAQGPRPNVVVVMTDDQDASSMWAMRKTRRLLGNGGTTFANTYTSFPLCCPSRATFLTGQYAHNHRVLGNVPPFGGHPALDHSSTLPVWLSRAGYATAHVGRYLNAYGVPAGREINRRQAKREIPPGWRHWFAPVGGKGVYRMYNFVLNQNRRLVRYKRGRDNYQTDVYARHATRLIRRLAPRPRPLFLSVAPLAPHGEVPRRPGMNPRPAPRHARTFPFLRLPRPPSFNEEDVSDKPPRIQALPRLDGERVGELVRRYRGRIRSLLAVDDAVAGMARALRRAGQLRNTLFVFTSDQGFPLGEHRIAKRKVFPYEETVRVPLLMRGPSVGVPRGVTRELPVSNVDLAATILDATGVQPGLQGDGISLLPVAANPDAARDRAVLLEDLRPGRTPGFAGVRLGRWTYVEHEDGSEELYDLASDPFQLQSLHDDPAHAPRKAVLAARLEALRECAGAGCR